MTHSTPRHRLDREFYLCDGLEAAEKLLGKILVHHSPDGLTAGRITELEAYMGENDKGCHAYVYLIYGMYCCMNIIVNREEIPHCIFLRALEPIDGIDLMKSRRGTDKLRNLCSGPGKLCIAMGIDKSLYGEDLCGSRLWLEDDGSQPDIMRGKRINIDYAEEAADFNWRFAVKGSRFLSAKI